MKFTDALHNLFYPIEDEPHNFILPTEENSISNNNQVNEMFNKLDDVKEIFPSIDVNIEYIKTKYNLLINSDIVLREFTLSARNRQYRAFLLFIDGMVNIDLVNNYILKPLMLKNGRDLKNPAR